MSVLGTESLKAELHGFETLGLWWRYISYLFTLLMSAFSLLISPAWLTPHLRRLTERSATILTDPQLRYMSLAPVHLRRKTA